MTLSIEQRMVYRIRAKGRGWVFSARHFLDFGSRKAVDLALFRLANRGDIRRLGRGIYDYPKTSLTLGLLSPSIDAVAKEIAGKNNSKLKITGAQAANALGLSTQVPARIVYLTDGPSRQMKIGRQTIILKHTSPKTMSTAGKGSGAVIEALQYLEKENINAEIIAKIKTTLSEPDKKELSKDISGAPDWLRPIINEIAT
ncbi:MAG: DUF6088 family protein [Acidobacteriota bacterium]